MKNQSGNQLVRPDRLKPGDRVGVAAPAGPVDPEQLARGLACVRRMGWEPVLGRHVLSRDRFLAGADADRAGDLMAMFEDKGIKGIFCARGGYGAIRVLPRLDPKTIRKNPKVFVGASDITLLLNYLVQKCSLVAFHGPMVAGNFGRHPMKRSRKQFRLLLGGEGEGKKLVSPQARVLKRGTARGVVAGGCLTLLCRSLGTPWEIQTRDKILLIEDVNEAPYRIDGMLWQLKQAGKFEGVKGVVFGEMVDCQAPKKASWSLDDAIRDVFDEYSFPILANFPAGHGREMWTLPFGVEATMSAGSKSLAFADCGVV